MMQDRKAGRKLLEVHNVFVFLINTADYFYQTATE